MIPSSSPTTYPRPDPRLAGVPLPPARALALLLAVALAACAPAPVLDRPGDEPPLPGRTVAGAAHYRVAADDTQIYARVFRAGSMAKLGHNHVVLFPGARGDLYLAEEPGDSLFDLAVPVAGAEVDPPALRARQGREFQSEISDDARSRTRSNMLGEDMLDAAGHPYVVISSSGIEGSFDDLRVTFDITIRDATRRRTAPVSVRRDEDGLRAEGRLELLQSDFGIEPFEVLGGALRVEDRVELVFTVAAERAD